MHDFVFVFFKPALCGMSFFVCLHSTGYGRKQQRQIIFFRKITIKLHKRQKIFVWLFWIVLKKNIFAELSR